MSKSLKMRQTGCPISFSLDIFGDRWTLLILRDLLLFGKQRYGAFLDSDEGIASNILSDRLKRLEAAGILKRESDPGDRRQYIYKATKKGEGLLPVLLEIAAWGASHDASTSAPKGFVKAYFENREAFHKDPAGEMSKLVKQNNQIGAGWS